MYVKIIYVCKAKRLMLYIIKIAQDINIRLRTFQRYSKSFTAFQNLHALNILRNYCLIFVFEIMTLSINELIYSISKE